MKLRNLVLKVLALIVGAWSVSAQTPVIVGQPQSQTGGVGGTATLSVTLADNGNAALPAASSGTLRLWLKADSGVVTNGLGQLSQWQDQSGNINHATQSDTNLQPLLVNSGLMNGKATVRFDGVPNASLGDYMQGGGDVAIPDQFTAFLVYSASAYPDTVVVPFLVGVPGNTYGGVRDNSFVSGGELYFSSWAYDYRTHYFIPTNTARILEDRYDSSRAMIQMFDVTANSQTNFALPTSGESAPDAGYYVGGLNPAAGSTGYPYRFAGDISELLVFRGYLGESDRQSVEGYLKAKYLLPPAVGPYSYQWRLNGADISGATNSSFSIPNAQVTNSGSYSVVVCNAAGCSTSSVAAVSFYQTNDCLSAPSGLVGWWPGDGNAFDFISTNHGTLNSGATFGSGVSGQAFQFSGNSSISMQDASQLRPQSLSIVGWFSLSSVGGLQNLVSKVAGNGTSESYVIFMSDANLQATVGDASGIGNVLSYSLNPSAGQWYHFAYTFDDATKQQVLYVNGVAQASGLSGKSIGYDTHPLQFGAEYESQVLRYFLQGKLDEVQLFNRALSGSEVFAIYAAGTNGICKTLAISAQPQSQSVSVGGNAAFNVLATGRQPMTYHWLFGSTPLASTNSSLIVSNAQSTDAGPYYVVVSDVSGSVTSSAAILSVGIAPSISGQPLSQTVAQNSAATFNVTAQGDSTLSYQWLFNGNPISGATDTSFSIASAQATNVGSYSVVVSNSFGAVTSSAAMLKVDVLPVITSGPQSQTVTGGQTAVFSVSSTPILPAVPSGTLSLWLKADSGVVTNSSGFVSVWQDQSGNNNHASQGNANLQPILTNSSVLAGRPALRFDGVQVASSGDFLRGTNNLNLTNAYTSFLVHNMRGTNNEFDVTCVGVPGNYGADRINYVRFQALAYSSWTYDYWTSFIIPTNTARIWTDRMPTNRASIEIYDRDLNNSTNFTFAVSSQSAPAAGYYVGGVDSSLPSVGSGRNYAGDIAELIYYRGYLSDNDRSAVESYLAQKYFGAGAVSYQWQFNGSNISGATNSALTIGNVQNANVGTYSVVVCNGLACVSSSNATLEVAGPLSITTQPASQTVSQGVAASFSVVATGAAPLKYQWSKDGAVLPGATNSTYSIASVQPPNIGDYTVVVTNTSGSVTSTRATLSIPGVPAGVWQGLIAYYPFSGNAIDASGQGNNGNATNVVFNTDRFGQTNSSADFSSNAFVEIPALNAMAYYPVTYSVWVKLNRYWLPGEQRPGDMWSDMTLVGREMPGSTTQGAVCFQYQDNGSPSNIVYYTGANSFSTGLCPATNQWIQLVFTLDASNRAAFYSNGQLVVSSSFVAAQSAVLPFRIGASASLSNYRTSWKGSIDDLRIYNRALSSNDVAQLYASEAPPQPTITTQPQSQTVSQGSSVSFTVQASGTAPITYQWSKAGNAITGATNSIYNVANAQPSNIGSYTVVVNDAFGSVTSSAATLSISGVPSELWQGLIAYYPFSGDSTDASGHGNNGNPANVVYGIDRFGQTNSAADFSSGNAYVDIPSLNAMQYHPITYSAWFKLNAYPTAAERRSDGYFEMTLLGRDLSGSQSEGVLCLYDLLDPAYPDTSLVYYTGATGVVGKTPETNKWIQVTFTIDTNNNATFYWNGQFLNTIVFSAAQNANVPFRIGHSASSDYRLGWKGMIDDVRVYNRTLSSNEVAELFAIEAPLSALVPSIQTQPMNAAAAVGSNTTFSVVADGAQPLTYQWLLNGLPLSNGTANAYTVITPQLSDDGSSYSVIITNNYGAITSAVAVLSVGLPPNISSQPASQTVAQGTAAAFTANVIGTAPITVQWNFNGTAIVGATNATLSLVNIQKTNSGSYSYIATSPFGSVTSSNATLSVDLTPIIGTQPISQTTLAGNNVTFSVGADPALPAVSSGTMRLWLKADAGVVTNAVGLVSQWQDQSGNANNARQNNTNQQPLLVAPPAINGHPALRFDGLQSSSTGDYMQGTNDVSVPDGYTSFAVGMFTGVGNGSGNVLSFVGTPGTSGAGRAFAVLSGQMAFATWANDYYSGYAVPPGSYRIWTERLSTNLDFAELFDRTYTTSNYVSWATSELLPASSGYYVGGMGPFTRNFPGDVAEFIVYRGSLSDSDRLAVEQYLNQKYYQTIPSAKFTYQWQFNGADILGATNATLSVTNAQLGNAGTYDVVVCNGTACVTSSPATLAVFIPPSISLQPVSQSIIVGNPVTFTATAAGSAPLNYQWQRNGANIAGATNTSLTLASVQQADAGSYALVLSSPYGTATSSNAILSVITSTLLVGNVAGTGASAIQVPIYLSALGTENALGFSLNFDPTLFSISSVALGSNASGATIFSNTNQQSSGRVGIVISYTSGDSFAAGTQQVAVVTFNVGIVATNTVTAITFGDSPTVRQLSDALANSLPATYVPGSVTLSQTVFEGDVSPRPNGNQGVTITDWVQVGRFVAGLDSVGSPSEFQRADCAPRNSLGNAKLTVSDWVQAGRYAVGLDPLTPVGGPTVPTGNAIIQPHVPISRTITLQTGATSGVTNIVSVQLNAQGDESAIGFSLSFDSQLVQFTDAKLGSGAAGATMNVNSAQAATGTIGIALELPFGQTFPVGTQEVVRLSFVPVAYSPGSSNLTFTDSPVIRDVSDATANSLLAAYYNSTLSTTGLQPSLSITQDGSGNVTLMWPAAANGYGLESVTDLSTNWQPVAAAVVTNGASVMFRQPAATNQLYFRLRHP